MYYTGIGSRETPDDIMLTMTKIARRLKEKGMVLRSGAAPGADTAFEDGAGDHKQIFVPWNGFQGKSMEYPVFDECYDIASKLHPAWQHLSRGPRALMARNCLQVLGPNLDEPVDFVICWTQDAVYSHEKRSRKTGGTGLAISLASKNNIPIFNLKNKIHYNFVMDSLIK